MCVSQIPPEHPAQQSASRPTRYFPIAMSIPASSLAGTYAAVGLRVLLALISMSRPSWLTIVIDLTLVSILFFVSYGPSQGGHLSAESLGALAVLFADYTLLINTVVLCLAAYTLYIYTALSPAGSQADRTDTPISPAMTPVFYHCTTKHARYFPKKHSFKYSYLCVGIPIALSGNIGRLFSAQQHTGQRLSWSFFGVNSADHLKRGARCLRAKLEEFLAANVGPPSPH